MIELLVPFIGSFLGVLFGYYATIKYASRQAGKAFRTERATNAGVASGIVRNEKGLNSALMNDILNEQSPLIGMVLNYFPSAKEYLMKNPNAIPYLLKIAAPLIDKYISGNNGRLIPGQPTNPPSGFNMRL